jgi:anti-sigma B factor antagonist
MEFEPAELVAVIRPGTPVELAVSGDLDLATVDQFGAAIDAVLATQPEHVVLDLAGVGFIDSAGIKGMVKLANRCQSIGAALTTVNASAQARRILELTRLTDLFDLR